MIGPALPPSAKEARKSDTKAGQTGKKQKVGPAVGPTLPDSAAPTVRRATIGPSAPPLATPAAAALRKVPIAEALASKPSAVDKGAVALCRTGELPPKGWSSKWSAETKKASLAAAIEAAQMHVVYALKPRSSAFQVDVGAAALEQTELDKLLREHATGKRAVPKGRCKEAINWLLEEGASLEAMCASADFETRAAAAQVLCGLSGEEASQRAAQMLVSEEWQARSTAADAFARLDVELVRPHIGALARLLGDEQSLVRMAAVTALGRLGADAAKPCAATLSSDKARAREAAAEVLGRIGAVAAEHAEKLAGLLEDRDWQVPTAAATALKKIGDAAAPHVAEILVRCAQPSRPAVIEALTRIGGKAAADAAAGLLGHGDSGVRRAAAHVLGAVGPEAGAQHRPALSALTSDTDKDVRQAARRAMSQLGHRSELPALEGDGDALPDVVAAALEAASGKSKGRGPDDRGGKRGSKGNAVEAGARRTRSRSRNGRRG